MTLDCFRGFFIIKVKLILLAKSIRVKGLIKGIYQVPCVNKQSNLSVIRFKVSATLYRYLQSAQFLAVTSLKNFTPFFVIFPQARS